jgi:hypothetical protein
MQELMMKHRFKLTDSGLAPSELRVNGPTDLMTKTHAEDSGTTPGKTYKAPRRIIYPSAAQTRDLFDALVESHLRQTHSLDSLDQSLFEDLVQFNLRAKESDGNILDNASRMLTRLPSVPIEFYNKSLEPAYEDIPEIFLLDPSTKSWEGLRAVHYVSSSVLSLVLSYSSGGDNPNQFDTTAGHLCDSVARLIERLHSFTITSESSASQHFVLKVFYWNIWQRTLMLRSHSRLGVILRDGFNPQNLTDQLNLRYKKLHEYFQRSQVSGSDKGSQTEYMCKWALELFKNNPNSLTLDFRHLFRRYEEVYGAYKPRCIRLETGVTVQCEGHSPLACQRFVGMKIENQSAHSPTCDRKCRKLHWNETSYRNTAGGRAVSVNQEDDGLLKYCTASENTIAISHVWSHGQGGRPELGETGLNQCLHERYTKIAKAQGCDSYWMDTPCIPSDHDLRKQAIGQINSIFENSKVTLVCDRDVPAVDVSTTSVEDLERLLAVFLLCDWNIRAWTLLEGMRGRKNMHLLCKDDEVLSFYDVVRRLQQHGRIDLSILALVAQHLIPAYLQFEGREWNRPKYAEDWDNPGWAISGTVDPFEAASLLSHRHASRGGDDVVIWSLICTRSVFYTAQTLWTDGILTKGRFIPTGFLISSLPRLREKKGLSWAPSQPDLPTADVKETHIKRFPAFSAHNSRRGRFTGTEFRAVWLQCVIKCPKGEGLSLSIREMMRNIKKPKTAMSRKGVLQGTDSKIQERIDKIVSQHLKDFKWGALLRPVVDDGKTDFGDDFIAENYVPFDYGGVADGPLLAVIGSNDNQKSQDGRKWIWLDIFEWTDPVELPAFTPSFVLLA